LPPDPVDTVEQDRATAQHPHPRYTSILPRRSETRNARTAGAAA